MDKKNKKNISHGRAVKTDHENKAVTVVEDCYHDREQWLYSIHVDGRKENDSDTHTSKKTKKVHSISIPALVLLSLCFFIVHHKGVPVVQVLLFCAGTKDGRAL